ncbi:hypothetical protein CO659_12730 [Rhizobium sp. S9]|uniref:hypothetical protein n=1 Tax=Rhizobium sp. S9 TaxID=2035454 RepID=UPI000BEAE6DC|nr:hypothetical protein [Rhizobium sp. S9]PDS97524.1 hypothetical protein CO659_12730 [Rhizobium sp. S9]
MPNREIHNVLHFVPLFDPKAAVTDNTAQVSAIIDLAGYNAAEIVLQTGTLTDADATFAVTVAESDAANMSGSNAVAASQLVGTLAQASFDFNTDSKARKIGYIGTKRYIQVTVTPANNTGNLFLSGVAVLGYPATGPTANPPQA